MSLEECHSRNLTNSITKLYNHDMSTATIPPVLVPGETRPVSYEEYLASPVEKLRYDILDGYKVYRRYGLNAMTSPSRLHQETQGNLYVLLREFATSQQRGQALLAPCDVLIDTAPLKVRQPDVLLISHERLAHNPPAHESAPLCPAPELVVEIVSPSDRPGVLAAKLADYRSANVREVWIVNMEAMTIEVVALSVDAIDTVATLRAGESVTSRAFPGLVAAVDAVFARA